MAIDLTFHGAARQGTGSCFLLQSVRCRLLVDCGKFQGLAAVERAARPFAFDLRELDFVLLTPAHVGHGGLLPRLAADGSTGPIDAMAATAYLLAIMRPDSAYLQQVATERADRRFWPASDGRYPRRVAPTLARRGCGSGLGPPREQLNVPADRRDGPATGGGDERRAHPRR